MSDELAEISQYQGEPMHVADGVARHVFRPDSGKGKAPNKGLSQALALHIQIRRQKSDSD
jgi:hypothetical protein